MLRYTVLGAGGFIGSALVGHLQGAGHLCQAVGRNDKLPDRLGHVIYCIGLNGAHLTRSFDMMDAHVSALAPYLRMEFDSFTYLSSTRLYQRVKSAKADESTPLSVDVNDPNDIFNVSKLAGEALCLAADSPNVRIARISNVFGGADRSTNFLTAILDQILTKGKATFFISMKSEKDYIDIRDVVRALELLPVLGKSRIYNVASGFNVSNREIAELIRQETGRTVDLLPNAPDVCFPLLSIERLRADTDIKPRDLRDEFPALVEAFRRTRGLAPSLEGGG